jgi:UDP-GlcNAc:undecaprenyl-phosphate GlcNAc-1-phosphate transferase
LVGKSFTRESIGIFLAATFLVLLGMIDDRFELDALTKLAGQALAAGILLIYGVQIFWLPINGVMTLPPSIGQLLTVVENATFLSDRPCLTYENREISRWRLLTE